MEPRVTKFVLLLALLSGGVTDAQTRTSADYAITAEAVNMGGQITSGGAYSMNGSVGMIDGLSSVAAAAERLMAGYIVQLYNPYILGPTSSPLLITSQNRKKTGIIGQPFAFEISPLTGEGPFTYQWLFNGSPIPGANGTSYSIGSVSKKSAGDYTVQVTNPLRSATAAAFGLTVSSGVPAITRWTSLELMLLLFATAALRLPKAGAPRAKEGRTGSSADPARP